MKKLILDLCGGTGAWSKPYVHAGYDVKVVTLPAYDVRNFSVQGFADKVHGILAAPPCTMFSVARTTAKTPRDFRQGMETVKACLHIIWECYYFGKPAWWALENPTGYLRRFLGKPVMTFEPYQYGDPYSKRTDLWGYFTRPKQHKVRIKPGWVWEHIKRQGNISRQEARAITPAGFSMAFFEANP